jgi:GDPmannose 4,6-dehydratase
MARALITGITGQDGSLLADHLLSLGYEVIGAVHTPLTKDDPKRPNYEHLINHVQFVQVDFLNTASVKSLITQARADECYHLGAQSFPAAGFSGDFSPFTANTQSTYELLAAFRESNTQGRFFFAGSSEIFGNNPKIMMSEVSEALPRTLYGISKLAGRELIRNHREQGFYACTGYLFNHESPRRGEEFVTRKITLAAAKIKHGLQKELTLGSLDAKRDWSWAPDFVKAFHQMLQLSGPEDLVLGSGHANTVGEFAELAFASLGLKAHDYIKIDERFNRPSPNYLIADTTRAQATINWKPSKNLSQIVESMVKHDYDLIARQK